MPARIRIITDDGAPPQVILIGNTATIGRTPENTVCIANNARISRQHSLIRRFNGPQYQILDLGSRNGTYVGEQLVVTPVTLEDGSVIRVPGARLHFETVQEDAINEATIAGTLAATASGNADPTRRAAILVCDILGFSTVSETLAPNVLARTLGSWFAEAGNAVNATGGTVDKFIGDALLAYWPESMRDSAGELACTTALEVGRKLLAATRKRTWPESAVPFRVRIALHFGSVVCSNIGIVASRDATIIGDAVNTAFRLETVMKQFNQRLVLSQDFAGGLAPECRLVDLGEHELKGKKQRVRVYAPADLAAEMSDTLEAGGS